ncbi:MAG: alkaline phosphatase family protein [Candidatus Lernaella stagnicola]|nr:alkaline phosphatase family protein [Candidatus Lernaella stagnicola]
MRQATAKIVVALVLAIVLLSPIACLSKWEEQPRVLLIGIEGVSWDLINAMVKAGEAPNFARLRRDGAWGVLESPEPIFSAGFWVTVATGRTDADHHVIEPIVYDEKKGELVVPERDASAVWEIMAQNHIPAGVIGWPGSAPLPSELEIGIDDLAFYRGLGAISAIAGQTLPVPELPEDYPHFAITTPPGGSLRARIAVASLSQVPDLAKQAWPRVRFLAVYLEGVNSPRHFAGIGRLLGENRRRPAYAKVSRKHVRRIDEALGRLLDLAGPRTLIMVASNNASPGPWRGEGREYAHRINGVVGVIGPGIEPGRRMENPTVLDFVPMALAHMDLPLSEQMPGNPFEEAWKQKPSLRPKIASHDIFLRRPYPKETPLTDRRLRARAAWVRDLAGSQGRPFNPRNRYALELLERGQVTGAATEALRDLDNDASNPVSQYVLGEVRLYARGIGEALTNFAEAAAALGDSPKSHAERGLRSAVAMAAAEAHLAGARTDLAERDLRPALAMNRGLVAPVLVLAEIHLTARDPKKAAAVVKVVLGDHEKDANLWLVLGRAERKLGHLDAAVDALENAITFSSEPMPVAQLELGLVFVERNQWRRAVKPLRNATEADPTGTYAWLQLAQAYGQIGDTEQEEEALLACLRIAPDNVDAWVALRRLLQRTGRHDEAERVLAAARGAIAVQTLPF